MVCAQDCLAETAMMGACQLVLGGQACDQASEEGLQGRQSCRV